MSFVLIMLGIIHSLVVTDNRKRQPRTESSMKLSQMQQLGHTCDHDRNTKNFVYSTTTCKKDTFKHVTLWYSSYGYISAQITQLAEFLKQTLLLSDWFCGQLWSGKKKPKCVLKKGLASQKTYFLRTTAEKQNILLLLPSWPLRARFNLSPPQQ